LKEYLVKQKACEKNTYVYFAMVVYLMEPNLLVRNWT